MATIISQVLKNKYFQHKNIFEAKLGYDPSFIWNNLYSSIDLVRERSYWKVGNGHNIRVLLDKWIPFVNSCTVPLDNCTLPITANVKALIKEEVPNGTGMWFIKISK